MTLAVVFGGGGARGAFQAGAWAVLAPYLKPDLVIGSSIGAINAWATTRMRANELVSWWQSRAPQSLPPYQTKALDAVISELLAMPRQAPWPALAVCSPVGSLVPHVVMLHAATGHAWLRASAALPGWYAPVKIGDKHYVDGGVLNDLPITIAKAIGATQVLALSAAGLGPTPGINDAAVLVPARTHAMLDFSVSNRLALLAAGKGAGERFLQTDQFARLVEISGKKVQNGKQH